MDMEVVLQACLHGAPVHACSVPTLGGTAPITPAGAIVLAGVEVLALTLIIQAVKPGTPVLGLATALYVEPGGHFLEQPGTLTHCRDGLPRPLFAGGVRAAFEAGRNADLTARASALAAKQVGENYSPRGIPGSPQDEWDRIVAEADRVLISNV